MAVSGTGSRLSSLLALQNNLSRFIAHKRAQNARRILSGKLVANYAITHETILGGIPVSESGGTTRA